MTVPVGDSLQEIDEDLYRSLGDLTASLPRVCALGWGSPPILDVRLHKALTYFLEAKTHYGAPLWAGVDPGFEGASLDLWDEQDAGPCVVWLPGSARRGTTGPR